MYLQLLGQALWSNIVVVNVHNIIVVIHSSSATQSPIPIIRITCRGLSDIKVTFTSYSCHLAAQRSCHNRNNNATIAHAEGMPSKHHISTIIYIVHSALCGFGFVNNTL